MFPQFKKINNESGIVLFVVLMTSIIIMIYSLGVLTQSLNEVNYAQQQIDQITAEEWSKGEFWNAYSTGFAGGNAVSSTSFNNRTYNYGLNYYTNGENSVINVTSNYDSFQ